MLGYRADARLFIINADDFGMCHSVNEAIFGALVKGMRGPLHNLDGPCPWLLHAMRFLVGHPEIPFGVHLTAISEWVDYRWGPVTSREKAPSLIDNFKDIIKEEGIILLGYRALQDVWRDM